MLLTPEQLQEIRQIIENHHDAFVVNAIDPSAVTPDILKRLKAEGLIDPSVESIKDSYLYGQLVAMLESAQVAKMGFAEFKKYLARNPIPLSTAEHHAVQMAAASAAQYCKGLGNTVNLDTGAVLIEADAKLRARMVEEITDATAQNIARRQSVKALKTDLGWIAKDWARDWTRIAVTEKQNAMQHGQGDAYRKQYGDDVLVAKRALPGACQWCQKLYNDPNGQPRIFKLSTLEANGTNVGRKAADWRATLGTVHPFCSCVLVRIPAGWGFNTEGDLEPGGKLGYVYDDEGDLMLAMRAEDNLRKAFKLQGHIEYQGLSIAVENRKGSTRKWKDADGNTGETRMKVAYGYLKRTRGADSDEIDCFVGPDPRAENVYVVEQLNPSTGIYDEQKVFLGYGSQDLAIACYRAHYDKPDKFILTVSPMKMDQFKRWIGATMPAKAEGLQKGLRLVVPLEKARVPDYIGAATSPADNRAPGPGIGANYVFLPRPKRDREVARIVPGIEELLEERAGENPLKRDKADYEIGEDFRVVNPIFIPEDFTGAAEARKNAKANLRYVLGYGIANVRRPKNTVEISKAVRTPVLEKAGPYIGPRGGRWADPKLTIPWKERKPRKMPRVERVPTPREKKPKRVWFQHKPGLPKTTVAKYKNPDGTYKQERKAVHNKVLNTFLKDKKIPVGKQKVAVVLMGGPASGKTTLVKRFIGKEFGNFTNVNPDDVKELLPEYGEALEFDVNGKKASARDAALMCHEESSDLASEVYNKAMERGLNLVIDGTGAKAERHVERIRSLRGASYHVILLMPDLDPEVAVERSAQRAEETGRFVPTGPPPPGTPDIVRDTYKKVPQNFEALARLADEFGLFDARKFPFEEKWTGGRGKKDTIHDTGFVAGFKKRVSALAQTTLKMPEMAMAKSDDDNDPFIDVDEIAQRVREAPGKKPPSKPKRFDRHTGVEQVVDDEEYGPDRRIRYGEDEE